MAGLRTLGKFRGLLSSPRRRGGSRPAPCRRAALAVEWLEDRRLLAGSWSTLTNLAPSSTGTMMLLTDGTVLAQQSGVSNGWYKLTPNASGSYVDGTWSTLAPMHEPRLYYGSNVLPDGRVFVIGGEYPSFTNT